MGFDINDWKLILGLRLCVLYLEKLTLDRDGEYTSWCRLYVGLVGNAEIP